MSLIDIVLHHFTDNGDICRKEALFDSLGRLDHFDTCYEYTSIVVLDIQNVRVLVDVMFVSGEESCRDRNFFFIRKAIKAL
jgi:hypothetical protein